MQVASLCYCLTFKLSEEQEEDEVQRVMSCPVISGA